MFEIKTQKDLDKAVKDSIIDVKFTTKGTFDITKVKIFNVLIEASLKWDITLVARGSSQPSIVAWGSSQPSIVARESSQPRIEAWESSQPRIEARESSQPSIVAWGYVSLNLFGIVSAKLSAKCHAFIHNKKSKVTGGTKTIVDISTSKAWCEYYGVTVKSGLALLYKGVNEDYSSNYDKSFKYTPGTMPQAEECDDEECSKGLHFSPHPQMTKQFHPNAKKFIACWVKLDLIKIHPEGDYPQKCKAPKVEKPCFEVNENGEPL